MAGAGNGAEMGSVLGRVCLFTFHRPLLWLSGTLLLIISHFLPTDEGKVPYNKRAFFYYFGAPR